MLVSGCAGLVMAKGMELRLDVLVLRGGIKKMKGHSWVGADNVEKHWWEWGLLLNRLSADFLE